MRGVRVESTVTVARVELVDIYTTYYWLHHAQAIPEHEEVVARGDDQTWRCSERDQSDSDRG